MSESCLFCRLARSDELPFHVLATEALIAFPALHPVNPGHLVVVTRDHYEWPDDLPQELAGQLLAAGLRLAQALQDDLDCPGYTLTLHGGAPSQPLPHVYLNVIPRHPGDALDLPPAPEADREELQDLARRLKRILSNGQ